MVAQFGATLGLIDLALTPPTLPAQRGSTRQDPRCGQIEHTAIPTPAADGSRPALNAPLAAPPGAPDGAGWSLAIERPAALRGHEIEDILLVLTFDVR